MNLVIIGSKLRQVGLYFPELIGGICLRPTLSSARFLFGLHANSKFSLFLPSLDFGSEEVNFDQIGNFNKPTDSLLFTINCTNEPILMIDEDKGCPVLTRLVDSIKLHLVKYTSFGYSVNLLN